MIKSNWSIIPCHELAAKMERVEYLFSISTTTLVDRNEITRMS